MARRINEASEFKRIAKHYAKAKNLFIQHIGEMYYITDGYTAIKVNPSFYVCYFQSVSGRYKDIANNDSITISREMETRTGPNIEYLFEQQRTASGIIRSYHGNIKEIDTNGTFVAILEKPNTDDLWVNFEYFDLFRNVTFDNYNVANEETWSAVYKTGPKDIEVIMLPIRQR